MHEAAACPSPSASLAENVHTPWTTLQVPTAQFAGIVVGGAQSAFVVHDDPIVPSDPIEASLREVPASPPPPSSPLALLQPPAPTVTETHTAPVADHHTVRNLIVFPP